MELSKNLLLAAMQAYQHDAEIGTAFFKHTMKSADISSLIDFLTQKEQKPVPFAEVRQEAPSIDTEVYRQDDPFFNRGRISETPYRGPNVTSPRRPATLPLEELVPVVPASVRIVVVFESPEDHRKLVDIVAQNIDKITQFEKTGDKAFIDTDAVTQQAILTSLNTSVLEINASDVSKVLEANVCMKMHRFEDKLLVQASSEDCQKISDCLAGVSDETVPESSNDIDVVDTWGKEDPAKEDNVAEDGSEKEEEEEGFADLGGEDLMIEDLEVKG